MVVVTPVPAARLASAENLAVRVGGAESNVAMFLAELGLRSVLASRHGDDSGCRIVLRTLREARAATRAVEVVPTA